ncbi:MAG TPA: hypothetical protein VK939_13850 [Longimicrobiales bacterium]|nr:hypothetical protein [Longimicrobiales bacterium]
MSANASLAALRRDPWPAARLAILPAAAVALLLSAGSAAAQLAGTDRINVYRYILDVDVPESPALLALDLAPARVPRAAAPKPVAAHLFTARESSAALTRGIALDVAPYYLAGGGVREYDSFRANSVAGRLMRVLTKTLVSVAVADRALPDGALQLGLGVRSTIHDPHDPVLNWGLADSVDARLRAAGAPPLADADEDVHGRGVNFDGLFARARRSVRGRCCVQYALGWGGELTARGGVLAADSATPVRHQLWAAAQITPGARYDLLASVRLGDPFGENTPAIGAGVQRKGAAADFRAELFYDREDGILPALLVETRLVPALSATASLGTQRGTDRAVFRAHLYWYAANRH